MFQIPSCISEVAKNFLSSPLGSHLSKMLVNQQSTRSWRSTGSHDCADIRSFTQCNFKLSFKKGLLIGTFFLSSGSLLSGSRKGTSHGAQGRNDPSKKLPFCERTLWKLSKLLSWTSNIPPHFSLPSSSRSLPSLKTTSKIWPTSKEFAPINLGNETKPPCDETKEKMQHLWWHKRWPIFFFVYFG